MVDAYCIAFRKALMLAPNVSEEVALATFVQGLQAALGAEVERHVPPNLQEAMRLARAAEFALRRRG